MLPFGALGYSAQLIVCKRLARRRVDHAHLRGVRARHIERVALRREHHLGRVLGGRPRRDDRVLLQVDHRDRRPAPTANERPLAARFHQAGVRVERRLLRLRPRLVLLPVLLAAVGRAGRFALARLLLRGRDRHHRDDLLVVRVHERHANDRIGPRRGDEQVAAGRSRSRCRRPPPLRLACPTLTSIDRAFDQIAAVEVEDVDHLELAAAGEDLPAVGREGEAVERPGRSAPATPCAVRSGLRSTMMTSCSPIPGAEHRRELAGGVDGDVDREVADFEVPPGGLERPLVRQLHEAVAGATPAGARSGALAATASFAARLAPLADPAAPARRAPTAPPTEARAPRWNCRS